ncbi:hypothetical protein L3X38_033490 [Prunus dulcis]|uniref:Uncharacterized protein n=1 Tax=Prunus dulcis TaxID=3755 RepID=A0AAD4VHP4_PRUDU|nr:hypothetical protein L3X38_033490 [Prunus dulcis]
MYEDTVGCNFDQNSMPESAESVLNLNPLTPPPPPQVLMPSPSETHNNNNNNNFAVAENLRLSMEELSYPHQQDHHAAMEIELQNELGSIHIAPILTRTTTAAIWFPLSNKPIVTIFMVSMITCSNNCKMVLMVHTHLHLTFSTFSAYLDAYPPLFTKTRPLPSQTPTRKAQILRTLWGSSEMSMVGLTPRQGQRVRFSMTHFSV